MIVRVFRARIQRGHEAEFEGLLRAVSVPLVERQDGLIACHIGRPVGSNANEFTMVSFWRDVDALRAFVGEEWEQAVIPDEREAAIITDVAVHHYEVIPTDTPPG